MSIVALIGVFVAIALGQQLPAGIFALIAVPCIVSVHFDTLLVAEFREQTWNSLMLLPVDPFEPLLAKLHASLWQRKAVLPPLLIATGFAVFENVLVVIMVAVLAPLAAIVLMEVSILNQFYAKSWWIGPLMALIFLGLIFGLIPVWIGLSLAISFMITLCVLSVLICVLYQQIRSRLLNWLEV